MHTYVRTVRWYNSQLSPAVMVRPEYVLVVLALMVTGNLGNDRPIYHVSDEQNRIVSGSYSDVLNTCNLPESWNILLKETVIIPDKLCSLFYVQRCYCLTTDSQPVFIFGRCFYGCLMGKTPYMYYQANFSLANKYCFRFNRDGALCGQCIEGYGMPAYSFSLKCVPCANESLWTTVPLYILVAYGPLTVFLAVIVTFTVSINSAPLRGWILACQILSCNILMRLLIAIEEVHPIASTFPFVKVLSSVYGIWNLDFFRSVYSSFCLHSSLTTLHVMALDYIIAVYPLLLISIMYGMVELYGRNLRPIVFIGRLFHHCCVRFRHRLDIRTSLIDAFGTFFALSSVKFLNTTINLLTVTKVWRSDTSSIVWYTHFDGSKEPLRGSHLVLLITAVLVTVFCNVLPLVLMLIYSFPRAQVLLNIFPASIRQLMFPFMDNILAFYKEGTNGKRICRYFGVVYHLALLFCIRKLFYFHQKCSYTGIHFHCLNSCWYDGGSGTALQVKGL